MSRRNLVAGMMPTWSTMGLQRTGTPAPLDRDLIVVPAELRPRTYLTNNGRNTGGDLGLGSSGLGPIGLDYQRPSDAGSSPSAPAAATEGCADCG